MSSISLNLIPRVLSYPPPWDKVEKTADISLCQVSPQNDTRTQKSHLYDIVTIWLNGHAVWEIGFTQ